MTVPKSSKHRSLQTEGPMPDGTRVIKMEDGTRVVPSSPGNIKRPLCGGIDVHKNILMAAACVTDRGSLSATFYVKEFSSSNDDIRRMAEWFARYGIVDVCMESTGKYWIPVFDILEQKGLRPVLTHQKYVRQVRGRKTDFRDAMNIANLFRMDVVVASFIPPRTSGISVSFAATVLS